MNDLEWNKIAAGVILAAIIAMVTGYVTDALYHPGTEVAERGYQIEGAEEAVLTAKASDTTEEQLDIGALMAAADAARGARVFKKCAACHTVDPGGPNRTGPNLHDIVGGAHAARGDFAYSSAFKAMAGKAWDYEALFAFLKKPKTYVPGTKMAFAGLRKPKDLADLVAYLRGYTTNPPPLPQPEKTGNIAGDVVDAVMEQASETVEEQAVDAVSEAVDAAVDAVQGAASEAAAEVSQDASELVKE